MRKNTFDKARRGRALATALGRTVLALAVLACIIGANAIASEGTFAYIKNSAINNVSVIDTETSTAAATVNVGSLPFGVAASPDGTKIYAASLNSNNTSVIDTATNTVVTRIKVGNNPWGLAVSPNGTKVYIVNSDSDNVSIIDTSTNTVTSSVNVGRSVAFGQFVVTPSIQPNSCSRL